MIFLRLEDLKWAINPANPEASGSFTQNESPASRFVRQVGSFVTASGEESALASSETGGSR
jgi:hypothetical protein